MKVKRLLLLYAGKFRTLFNSFGPYAFRARTNVEGAALVATLSGHRERTEERSYCRTWTPTNGLISILFFIPFYK